MSSIRKNNSDVINLKLSSEWNIAAIKSLCESFKSRDERYCRAKGSHKNFFLETVSDSFKYDLIKFIVHKGLLVGCLFKWEDTSISSEQIIRDWKKVDQDFIENKRDGIHKWKHIKNEGFNSEN